MPIDLLAAAADLIAGEGLELVKDKAKRKEGILRVLTKLGFSIDAPPANDFNGVYAYTLVVYGIDKPKPILEFFRHQFIKSAFRQSFETRDPSYLEEESENFLDWSPIAKELLSTMDYGPRQEFAEFREHFITAAKLTRTVQEVLVDHKLDDISGKLHELPTKDDLDAKLEPIYQKLNSQSSLDVDVQANEPAEGFSHPSTLFFVGQEDALENIAQGITSSNIVTVGGMAGIGKTYLVAHFVENRKQEYTAIWQDCASANQLEQVLLSLAGFCKTNFGDGELWQLLRNPAINEQRKLDSAANSIDKNRCLVVWDNFDAKNSQSLIPLILTLNKLLHQGRLIITTREFFELNEAFNPIYRYIVPPMSQSMALEFMKFYLNKLGLPDQPQEVLSEAYKRVAGHPYFMSRLIFLSETFPMQDLVNSLPQFTAEAHKYIQERVSKQLSPNARNLLRSLSVIRKPFKISAINFSLENVNSAFEELTRRFVITRQSQPSVYYEIHDLVKEFEISHLSPDELIMAHGNAANYYANLENRTYSDGIELINHRIEEKNYDEAEEVANQFLGSALHDGLFDLVVDITSQLIKENQLKNRGQIYFSRGRAFRLKGNLDFALESYRIAQAKAENEFIKESALLEISSMLAQQSEKIGALAEAVRLLNGLTKSKDTRIKASALTSLGYLNLKNNKTRKLGIRQLEEALKLAESEDLQRNIMQICQGLGLAYLKKNNFKNALAYLERSRSTRDAIPEAYGEQDIEADYHLYDLLANVYRRLKRYDDAVSATEVCVQIDRKYGFRERMAASLCQLGQDLCLLKNYKDAKTSLQESLEIIKTNNLGHIPEKSTVEWLAVAIWYLNQFEPAVELILEYISLNQKDGKGIGKHMVTRESDLRNQDHAKQPEFVEIDGEFFHLLVLPKEFTLQDVKRWNENVVRRRPDLAEAYNPVLLYN